MLNELIDPNAPVVEKTEEDIFAMRADLLMQGKLIKHLQGKGYYVPYCYEVFSEVAQEVAQADTESTSHGELYTATWNATYRIQTESDAKVAKAVIGLMIPVYAAALVASADDETFTFETQHRIKPLWAKTLWLRRLLAGLGQAVGGATFAGMGILSIIYLADKLSGGEMPFELGSFLYWIPVVLVAAGILFVKSATYAIPPYLRMYSGKTFQLVSLKRVK